MRTVKELAGFWSGGPYSLIRPSRGTNPLTYLADIRIPARKEIHPLASFILFTPPSDLFLKVNGETLDDDHFYLAVLLEDYLMTFAEALQKGRVYALFPGDGL